MSDDPQPSFQEFLKSPFTAFAVVVCTVPFFVNFTSSSSMTINGEEVRSFYRNYPAIFGGGLALLLAPVAFFVGTWPRPWKAALAGGLVLMAGVHLVRGFGGLPSFGSTPRPVADVPAATKEEPCTQENPGPCEASCAKGNGEDCLDLGAALTNGTGGLEKDFARALTFFEKGCELKSAVACRNAGILTGEERYGALDMKRSVDFYTRGCELNDGFACNDLGVDYDNALGVEEDEPKARGLFEKACTKGDAKGCSNLGLMLATGRGGPQDVARANEVFQKGCEGKIGQACNELGFSHDNARGVEKDPAAAKEWFAKGCALDHALSCTNQGVKTLFAGGSANPENAAAARPLFEKACTLKSARGCYELAMMVRFGTGGAEKDGARAVELFDQACAHGDLRGCNNAGDILVNGEGVPANRTGGIERFETSCAKKNEEGCSNLGFALASSDPERARPLLTEACAAKNKVACAELKNLPRARKKGR